MVQWNKIEHDIFHVPAAQANGTAVAADVVQPVSKKVRGFDNKRVGRLLAAKAYANADNSKSTNAVDDVGNMGSLAGYDEIFTIEYTLKD